jgi:hypothetical protein
MNTLEKIYVAKPNDIADIKFSIEKIKENFSSNTFAVIADWDRTLTCTNSSSWMLP